MGVSKKIKKITAALITLGMLSTAPTAIAETKKKETPKKPTGTYSIAPSYAMKGQHGSVRLAGGSSIYGIGFGGFLDLAGTKEAPVDTASHFGKITASKGLDSLVKGAGAAVELTTTSFGKDEIRAGIYKTGKLGKGGYKVQLYPLAPKGKGPSVGLFLSQELADKIDVSAFITSDLGSKSYYGEAQFSYGITKDLGIFVQERYGGEFGEKFKPEPHIGIEYKF